MTVDSAFEGAGKEPGLEIWRIEKLAVVKQQPKNNGDFYSGDSYIVLNTKIVGKTNKLQWDLHFWLGKDTSQDEQGVAAYKTVELDDYLGGGPVQHREVQEHESQQFVSYFRSGIKYLEGGVDSGFNKVERDVYEKRLLQVKGKRNVRVKQVECHVNSLNQGDVFILDDGLTIFIWNGPKCSKMEKIKAAEVAKRIKDEERGGKAQLIFVEERWDRDVKFFKALGSQGEITSEDVGGDDSEFERIEKAAVKLYRVSDQSGSLEITLTGSCPLKKDDLETQDCFILDTGPSGIYVWVGKDCTKAEKKEAWSNATAFLTKFSYPNWTKITQLVEGGETPLFKQYFSVWPEPNQSGFGKLPKQNSIATYDDSKFDVTGLHNSTAGKTSGWLPDNGDGDVRIWRIEDKEMVLVPDEIHGVFYSGDCYILLYTYKQSNRDAYIIYFWQGTKCSIDERGGSAILAQRLDDNELDGAAVQVRVVQGREPEHFLRMFKGKMMILTGGVNNEPTDESRKMFHIRGTSEVNTRAIQVQCRSASLNSNDVFVIQNNSDVYLWLGKGASEDEIKVATNIVNFICPDRELTSVQEGEEPNEFWDVIGDKEPYPTSPRQQNKQNNIPSRLFQCSNASGKFHVEEIVDFCQEDLIEDDVMLLDTFDEIFVWVGKGANQIEKKESLNTAMEYIRTDPAERSPDTTDIVQVKQGFEPPSFTGHFHAWDYDKWSKGKTYEELKAELGAEVVAVTEVKDELANYEKTYSYKELLQKPPPPGVDPATKEKHLSDKEFEEVFKMTKSEYLKKPQWKQVALKKQVKLF